MTPDPKLVEALCDDLEAAEWGEYVREYQLEIMRRVLTEHRIVQLPEERWRIVERIASAVSDALDVDQDDGVIRGRIHEAVDATFPGDPQEVEP